MALYTFIVSLLGVPLMIAGYWGLVRPAVHWWRERRWRKPEWNDGISAGVTMDIYLDALRPLYGTALSAAGSALCVAPTVYSGPNANYGGAATTIPATLVTPVR